MAALRQGDGGIRSCGKPPISSACRLVSAGAFLLSERGVWSSSGRMAVRIGSEERHDDRPWIELQPHFALRTASPGRWRACVGDRIRRRDDRLYGTGALVAAPVARRARHDGPNARLPKRSPVLLDPQRKSAVDARPRTFSGLRWVPAVHFRVAVYWRAGL